MNMNGPKDAFIPLDMTGFQAEMEASSDWMASLLDDEPTLYEPESSVSPSQTTSQTPTDTVDEAARANSHKSKLTTTSAESNTRPTTNDRQKEELNYLRAETVELEAQLAVLKKTRLARMPSVWEKIAKRQRDQKQKAVIENAKLRELLEGQLKVVRSLESLLHKKALRETASHLSRLTELRRLHGTLDTDAGVMLDEIRSRIHLQFDEIDTVMSECGLSLTFINMDDVEVTRRAPPHNPMEIELTVAKILPFPLDQVVATVWQTVSSPHINLHSGYFEASKRGDSMCDLQLVVQIQQRRANCVLVTRGVAARRTEADRSLVVVESLGLAQGTLLAQHPIQCRERGYVVMEKTTNETSSTIVRACKRLWPEDTRSTGAKTAESSAAWSFINLITGSCSQNTQLLLHLVENALLEQSSKT